MVKTGLRRLNVSYSRISLDDVRARLHLDSAASAEFVCAKAIKDGVIDAVIDHDNQQIRSKGVADVYSTNEPQKAFHRRIVFCLDVRNEAVKAMQYPPDTGKKKQPDEDDKEEKQTDGRSRRRSRGVGRQAVLGGLYYNACYRTSTRRRAHACRVPPRARRRRRRRQA